MRYWVLVIIVLVGLSPILAGVTAALIAESHSCLLDEGSVHPCVVAGRDIGPTLYDLSVSAWLTLITIPGAFCAVILWFLAVVAMYIWKTPPRP